MAAEDEAPVRLALNQKDAAAALGVSVVTFRKAVRPYVGRVDIGGAPRYPVAELERWIEDHTTRMDDDRGR